MLLNIDAYGSSNIGTVKLSTISALVALWDLRDANRHEKHPVKFHP